MKVPPFHLNDSLEKMRGKTHIVLHFLLLDLHRLCEALHVPLGLLIRQGAEVLAILTYNEERPGNDVITHPAVALQIRIVLSPM